MTGLMIVSTIAAAFAISVCAPVGAIPLLRRHGVVDQPSIRSLHIQPTVRGVGVTTALAVLGAGLVSWIAGGIASWLLVLLGAVGLAIVGALEDVVGLSIPRRLLLQFVLAAATVAALLEVTDRPYEIAITLPVTILVPLLALAVTSYVNAANFMDGIDGISGLHGVAAGGGYAVTGLAYGEPGLVVTGGVTAAAFAGFLPWNLKAQRVFLGDSGSYLLGGLVALSAVLTWLLGLPLLLAMAPTLLYIADTATTVLRRAYGRERIWTAHCDHTYQRLVRRGYQHLRVALLVAAATAACVLAGLLSGGSPAGLILALTVCALYLASPHLVRARAGTSQ